MGAKYRNYTTMILSLEQMYVWYRYEKFEEIHKNFGTSSLDEAILVMEKNIDVLPMNWQKKLRQKFYRIQDCFTSLPKTDELGPTVGTE